MDTRKRVLVVDDEISNRELLEALLTSLGHDVDMAADGLEALAMLDRSHDLVLLDVMMPGIDGYEVARRIRVESPFPEVPICMVTALSDRSERLRAVEAGANDFIAKPVDKTELRVRTASLLKAKEAQDAAAGYRAELEAQNSRLQESFEELRKLGELKDEFLRIASHDLKNPLAGVLGLAGILFVHIPPGAIMTERAHDWIAKIVAQGKVMQKIIEDFLDFRALEDGQMKLTIEPVDLNELVAEVLARNAEYAETKGIALHQDSEAGPLLAEADRNRLNQIFENLVGNAIKFSPKGKSVIARIRKTENGFLAEVSDCGPGLTDEDMQHLFEKYAKLSNMPTGGEKSSGLGLAICRKVVELQGGKIGARNNPEGGATFWFELPGNSKGGAT